MSLVQEESLSSELDRLIGVESRASVCLNGRLSHQSLALAPSLCQDRSSMPNAVMKGSGDSVLLVWATHLNKFSSEVSAVVENGPWEGQGAEGWTAFW